MTDDSAPTRDRKGRDSEADAFGAEIYRCEPILLGYAYRAVGDRDLARDLVQKTLMAGVAGKAAFEHRSHVRTWLVGILSNKIADEFRQRSRTEVVASSDGGEVDLIADAASTPEDLVGRQELLRVVDSALRELPRLERLAVLMVDVEGHSHKEACNAMELTPTHLRVLLHRGRHRIRKAVENATRVPTRP